MMRDAAGNPALRQLFHHRRGGMERPRLDAVFVLGQHRDAAGVPLHPYRPRALGVGERARALCNGHPAGRYGLPDGGVRPACVDLGGDVRLCPHGRGRYSRGRHGRPGARQDDRPVQAERHRVYPVLCAVSRARHAVSGHRSGRERGAWSCSPVASRRWGSSAPGERLADLWGLPGRGVLRLHRGLAPCRRIFVRGRRAAGRDDVHPPDGGRPDLGAGRSRRWQARGRGACGG